MPPIALLVMTLKTNKEVQYIAKCVHEELEDLICCDSTEASIANSAIELLSNYGIEDTWYYDVPAFVLLGSRSCLSISGRDYKPANSETVGFTNLVTVDLSPLSGELWGDCARSYVIENGRYTKEPTNVEFANGLSAERHLHSQMIEYVTPKTKFSELFEFGNDLIRSLDYENLDFLGNLGHSIETCKDSRRYIEKGCEELLGNVNFFTFEPHIRRIGQPWGYKHENIYSFNESGVATEL